MPRLEIPDPSSTVAEEGGTQLRPEEAECDRTGGV